MLELLPDSNNCKYKNASTYVKLQDAYVAEKGTTVGGWQQIGYVMKNSSNFYYCGVSASAQTCDDANGYGGTSDITTDTYTAYWTASSKAALNDCTAGSVWSLTTSQNSNSGGLVLYEAAITQGANSVTGACKTLTPNFEKLNTKPAS